MLDTMATYTASIHVHFCSKNCKYFYRNLFQAVVEVPFFFFFFFFFFSVSTCLVAFSSVQAMAIPRIVKGDSLILGAETGE